MNDKSLRDEVAGGGRVSNDDPRDWSRKIVDEHIGMRQQLSKSEWQKETDMLVAAQVKAYQAELKSLRAMAQADLKLAFSLGQKYWQQADSDSYSQNKKSVATIAQFDELLRKHDTAQQAQGEPA